MAYEITEQLGWKTPGQVYIPVSAGTLLLGIISGFRHLAESNVITNMPRILACQTRQVSPLYHLFKNLPYTPPKVVTSIADALVNTNPPLLKLMAKVLRQTNGDVVVVEEDEILAAFKELARIGFFVEPSSAVAYAAYKRQLESGEFVGVMKTVIVLTGTGLKTALKPT